MLARPVGLPCGAERVLDLDRAQSTRLLAEQVDDPLASAAALEARAGQDRVDVLAPGLSRSITEAPAIPTTAYPPFRRSENNSETQSHFVIG